MRKLYVRGFSIFPPRCQTPLFITVFSSLRGRGTRTNLYKKEVMILQKEQFDITGMTCSACSTRVEKSVAKQLVYSALNIKADEAYRIGLVNAVYPQAELMENVLKLANKIAKNAPIAVRNCKKAINDGISLPIEKAVEVEEKLFGDCFETHDQVEGMSCFLSREKPKPKAVFTNN